MLMHLLYLSASFPIASAEVDGPVAEPVVSNTLALTEDADLQDAYDQMTRRCMLQRSASCEQELGRVALAVAERDGDQLLHGTHPLVLAGRHYVEAVRLEEVRSLDGPPQGLYPAVFGFVDDLASATDSAGDIDDTVAVAAALVRLADRLERAPLLDDIGGFPGVAYRHKGRRVQRIVALEPGNGPLIASLWRAELIMDRADESFSAGGAGYAEATDLLRKAERSASTEAGTLRVMRNWAHLHALALAYGVSDNREESATRLIAAARRAMVGQELEEHDELVQWTRIGYEHLLSVLGDQRRVPELVERLGELSSGPVAELPWPERSAFLFAWCGEVWQILQEDLGAGLEFDAFRSTVDSVSSLADRAFANLYEDRPRDLDAARRARLSEGLAAYAGLSEVRGRHDLAQRARQLALELPAAVEQAVSVVDVGTEPTYTPLTPVERLARDAELLAMIAGEWELPADGRAERHGGRITLLAEQDTVMRELDGRWRQPGVLGEGTRDAWIDAMVWRGLAQAAAGNPGAAGLAFEMVAEQDALRLDAPVGDDGLTPRELLERWQPSTGAEVRSLVVFVPQGVSVSLVAGDRGAAQVQRASDDVEQGRAGWFHPDSVEPGRWVFTDLPIEGATRLSVGARELELPPGQDPLVLHLGRVDGAWTANEVPLPFADIEE